MDHPDEPAEISTAASGEVAKKPSNVEFLAVEDGDTSLGLLCKWNTDEWIYASHKACNYLMRKRSQEYDE